MLSPARSLCLSDILKATQGVLLSGQTALAIKGLSIDSRNIKSGALFWTLPGDRFDGHAFVREAIGRGAAGAVVGSEYQRPADWPSDRLLIRVEDRQIALQETAAFFRRQFPIPVVAITGSNGKTTTKEMIASILACQGQVLKTQGNFNNLIGLPLTLCRLSSDIEYGVLELGMNRFGEIRRLTEICDPQVGVVTNIGPAHIEFFGSLEQIRKAKGELFEQMEQMQQMQQMQQMGAKGTAIINYDDPQTRQLASYVQCSRVITFGCNKEAEVRAESIEEGELLSFLLRLQGETIPVHLPLLGGHHVYNALAAAATALALDISADFIKKGLESVSLPPMRMARVKTASGLTIINDAYNANPVSMSAALETVTRLKGNSRAIAVLGDMLELGPLAEQFHRQIGQTVASLPITYLFSYGQSARWIGEEAVKRGMGQDQVFFSTSHEEIVQQLKTLAMEGDWILVKGSRGAKMERVVHMLMEISNHAL